MPESTVVTENTEQMNLINISDYLEDPDGLLNVKDLDKPEIASQFKPIRGNEMSSGISRTVIWLKFELKYISYFGENLGEWLVEVGYPALDLVTLYVGDSWGDFQEFHTGDKYPFGIRDVAHPSFLFPVELYSNELTRFYLRIETSGSLQVPLKLWTPLAYLEQTNQMDTLFGIVYGILLVMMFYHLMLFIRRQHAYYLYYSIYLGGFLVHFLSVNGTGQALIWPDYPMVNSTTPFFMSISSVAGIMFTQSFLDLHHKSQVISRLFTVLLLGGLLIVPMSFMLPLGDASKLVIAEVQANLLITTFAGIYCLVKKRESSTWLFVIAFICQLTGAVFYSMVLKGDLGEVEFSRVITPLVMTLVAIILALAMARRNDQDREQEKAEEAARISDVRRDNQRLVEATGIKNEFLQAVASKLALPIAALSESLEKIETTEKSKPLKQAREAGKRASDIVENLVSLNEVQSSSLFILKVPFNLRRQVKLLEDKFKAACDHKGIFLEFHIDDSIPENLYGDARKIFKVVANVMDNAVKYTDDGFIAISARTDKHLEEDKIWLYLTVEDTGIGISELDKNIYQAFEQVNNDTDIKRGGVGLGLSVCRQLMHSMGGSITHTPRPKGGTCFEISVACYRKS
ncbi:sensor histidine kinase [Endozoicomonas sp. OPT23]|uniref:sensor histidine kinase n=1 Tax=Endozoicomonas sp. OPT23 TaxID=2072845 RepID=UPI0018912F90|nr:sensor histidine kinase [Endozoicomonas sp. OPT23]